ncbi:hypothetical protein V8C37DRAFT_382182 [Trichoderma ceciliae]
MLCTPFSILHVHVLYLYGLLTSSYVVRAYGNAPMRITCASYSQRIQLVMKLARQIKFANLAPNLCPCCLNACRVVLKEATGGEEAFKVFFLLAALHCRLRA